MPRSDSSPVLAVLLALAGVASIPGGVVAQEESPFTGEIKPVLYVQDVEASAAFFRDVLGFAFDGFSARADGTPYYAEMLAGDQRFGLHEPTQPGQRSRVGQQRLYFRVRDLDAHRRRVAESGGEPGEVVRTDWMDFFIVRDADGHEIVFAFTDPERHTTNPW